MSFFEGSPPEDQKKIFLFGKQFLNIKEKTVKIILKIFYNFFIDVIIKSFYKNIEKYFSMKLQ